MNIVTIEHHNEPDNIFEHIVKGRIKDAENYTYIILGKVGPTGKSRLCEELRNKGFNAFEITESIFNLVEYNDDKNHLIVDPYRKHVVIVLNRSLKEG